MDKEEVQKRVLHRGKQIELYDFSWDEKTKTFSSDLDNLVLDFSCIDDCNFITGYGCKFKTGSYCNFKTGFNCKFKTGNDCNFRTGGGDVFNTGKDCKFETYSYCTFKTNDEIQICPYRVNGVLSK